MLSIISSVPSILSPSGRNLSGQYAILVSWEALIPPGGTLIIMARQVLTTRGLGPLWVYYR